jgi:hypothetical protein
MIGGNVRYTAITLQLLAVCILTACTSSPPKCGDEQTLDLLRKAFIDSSFFLSMTKSTPEDVKRHLVISTARATSVNSEIKLVSCAADIGDTKGIITDSIAYTSQLDDKGNHVVSITELPSSEGDISTLVMGEILLEKRK